jgi:phosphatidylinositol 4-kinase
LDLFNEGQQQLKERSFNEDLRQSRSVDDEQPLANRLKMLIIANSMCIELIVWSCGDENTADLIYNTINERISQPHRHVLIQTPITVVALDALGKLAERFPSLASIIVTLLCNFLTEPCPLLTKLTSESSTEKKHSTANGDGLMHLDGQDSVIRRRFGFSSLRSAAIDALCRALKSANRDEDNDTVLQPCLAKLSAHLYLASQDKKWLVFGKMCGFIKILCSTDNSLCIWAANNFQNQLYLYLYAFLFSTLKPTILLKKQISTE